MGMLTEGAVLKTLQKMQKETERTNELLEHLLAEAKHSNELAHWQADQQKVP